MSAMKLTSSSENTNQLLDMDQLQQSTYAGAFT